jgi:SAM-dependent methyltransferase
MHRGTNAGLSEIERGRSEAAHTRLEPADVRPYLDPQPDTPYALRYAFYLLGDVRSKTVLDLGCGSGENMVPLLARGANVVALDISYELGRLAVERVGMTGLYAPPSLLVASAYNVPLPDGSVDLILCASVLHHLNIPRAMREMRRLLKPNGVVIVKEPVRFSKLMAALRLLFPARQDVSDDEHPLTREELSQLKAGWAVSGERAFRLPLIPLFQRLLAGRGTPALFAIDGWLLRNVMALAHFSTSRVMRLQKIELEN